jgi:hypothetical protein
MKQHFVTFLSPGTFMAELDTKPIESWDVKKAQAMSKKIKQRYGATPYAFYFTTRSRGPKDLDSKIVKESPTYWLHAKVETYEEVCARNDPNEKVLRDNMRINKYDKVVTNLEGYRWTQPLGKDDVVLSGEAK